MGHTRPRGENLYKIVDMAKNHDVLLMNKPSNVIREWISLI